jgi:multidrug efflux system outer membrane protein
LLLTFWEVRILRPSEGNKLKIPANTPSSLLQSRPDIAEAEARLKSAYAQVGVALADYFPRLTLTGSYGRSSAEFNDFFSSSAKTWSYGPGLTLPIFNAGRISSNVDYSEAKLKELEATYRNTWYKSLREVNDALISIDKTQQISELLGKQVKVLSRYLQLSRTRYEQGQTSYLEVLDAERRLFLAQLELTRIQASNLQSKIDFMKGIAGDWF